MGKQPKNKNKKDNYKQEYLYIEDWKYKEMPSLPKEEAEERGIIIIDIINGE